MRHVTFPVCLALVLGACSGEDKPPPTGNRADILAFVASPASIELGQEVTLTWDTVGTNGVNIEPRIGLQAAAGMATDRPLVDTTYVLTIPGGPSDLRAMVSVEVTGAVPEVVTFDASPRTIMENGAASLSWSTNNADSVTIEPGVLTDGQPTGTVMVMPQVTTTYRITAHRGTQTSAPAEVTVVVASGNQPVVKTFTASPRTVQAGDPVTLTWETSNADRVAIDNGVGQQPTTGTFEVRPMQTTTYTLSAVGPGGQATASVTVNVIETGDPVILRFDAVPGTIAPGGTAQLFWDTDNATGVEIDNGIGSQPAKGDIVVSPSQTTTYTLTAFGNGMQITQQVTLTVAAPNEPVILAFDAMPAVVLEGAASTLTWMTQNVASVDIDQGVGSGLMANDSIGVTPMATTTYTLTARGTNGSDVTAQVTVTVNPPPPVVVSFTAQPTSIVSGASTTLTWSTTNATDVTIDNGVGMQSPNGSAMVSPTQTTTYVLTANGPSGMTTSQVTVTVAAPGAPVIQSFTAAPQQISPGSAATLSWDVTGATDVTIDNGIGTQATMGTTMVTPATTTTYTLTANGAGGTTSAQVTVTVASVVGDTCADAFHITSSGTYTGNTLTAANDYAQSNSCTGYSSSGPDIVYRVTLSAGDRLQASLQPSNGSWDSSIYLVTSCSNISSSCVAGQDNGNPEQIDYTTLTSGDFFLIVDGFAGAGGTYALTIDIGPAPVPNDQCSGAIDVTSGGTFQGTTINATGDYTPNASGLGGCTGFTANSRDVTYAVTLAAGERLQASLDAPWDASLYVVTDCAMAASSCVAGQDNGNPEQVDYTATNAGTYFIIVDGYGSARGAFTLDVTVTPPVQGGDTCATAVMVPSGGGSFQSTTTGLANDYDPPIACTGYTQPGPDQVYAVAAAAGDVIEATSDFAMGLDGSLYVVTDCANLGASCTGADDGLGGQPESLRVVAQTAGTHYVVVDAAFSGDSGAHDLLIAQYNGDVCAEAAPLLTDGTAEFTTTAGLTNDYSPNSGGCTRFSASGPDRAYSVAVNPGDQLRVTYDPATGYDASLYVVSNCGDISGSCIAGSDRGVAATEVVAPVFQTSGTYYVIADGFASGAGTADITAEIRRGDDCPDAYFVPDGGGTFMGTTASYGANLGTTTAAGSCTNFSQTGNDAIYAVNVPNGDTLTASVDAAWDSAIYVVSDCAQAATTCLAGEDNGNPEQITYTNNSGSEQTYFVVVDSWLPSTPTINREGNYTLSITVQ